MSLATLSSRELSQVQKLVERKEELLQQVDGINRELEAIESSTPDSPRPARVETASAPSEPGRSSTSPRKGRGRQGRRGQLRARIMEELKAAGKEGVRVKEVAAKLGTSYGNVTAFFQTTGKKITGIKKAGPAHYVWTTA